MHGHIDPPTSVDGVLRLAVRCACGRRPAIRPTEESIRRHQTAPPEEPVQQYQCRACGSVYVITARAYHLAG